MNTVTPKTNAREGIARMLYKLEGIEHDLKEIQKAKANEEHSIKCSLIEAKMTDCLDINRSRLKQYLKMH